MRLPKYSFYFLFILLILGCEIPKLTPPEPEKAESSIPKNVSEPAREATPEMVEEYAKIHQISDLKLAEFYTEHPIYAKEHPYNPTEEDIAFYERPFLEKTYPEFNNLEAQMGFMKARYILMSNPPNGPGNRYIGSTKYVGIMQGFASGDDSGASAGMTNMLLEIDPAAADYQEAMKLYNQKHLDEAIEKMESAAKAKPESPTILYDLGMMYMERGDDPSAMQYLQKSLEQIKTTGFTNANLAIYPEVYMDASVNLGVVYTRNGMYDEAVSILKQAIQFRPDDLDANRNLGNTYYAMGDLDNAISQINRAIKMDPKNPDLHNTAGLIYYQKGLYDASLEEFQAAVKIAPSEKQYNYNMGLVLVRLGRQDEADHLFKLASGLKEGQDSPQAFTEVMTANKLREMYNEGCAAMSRTEITRAIELFDAVLKQNPKMAEAHINLGVCYRIRGERQKQISHFEEAARLKSDMPDIHYNLGLAYSEALMYPQAIAEFDRAVELRPSMSDAHFQIGVLLYKTGKFADAALEFKRSLQLSPRWFEALLNLGSCYMKTGDLDGATESFKEALQLKPNSAEANYSLGIAYTNAKRYDEALALFRKALELDPTHQQARIMLKELELFTGKQ